MPYIAPEPRRYDPPVRETPKYVAPAPKYVPPPAPKYEPPPERETPKYVPPPVYNDPPAPKYDPNYMIPEYTPPLYEEPREPKKRKLKRDPFASNERIPDLHLGPQQPSGLCSYRVRSGDTLTSIAEERYGVSGPRTIAKIAAVNPGMDPDRIRAGETIMLPKSLASVPVEPCPCKRASRDHEFEPEDDRNSLQLIPISMKVNI